MHSTDSSLGWQRTQGFHMKPSASFWCCSFFLVHAVMSKKTRPQCKVVLTCWLPRGGLKILSRGKKSSTIRLISRPFGIQDLFRIEHSLGQPLLYQKFMFGILQDVSNPKTKDFQQKLITLLLSASYIPLTQKTGWNGFKYFWNFSSQTLGFHDPIWRAYFFKWLGSTTN